VPDADKVERTKPDLILLIEEPELYQHPSRQRHFSTILRQLSARRSAIRNASAVQVVYCTHSPYFVGLDRFEQLRVVRKRDVDDGLPKATGVTQQTLDEVARTMWIADGSPVTRYTGESLSGRLHTLLTPEMNEGFFSDVLILVEGEGDRAALLATASLCGVPLESAGVSIIACGGKPAVFTAAAIFRSFGLIVYSVWDSDRQNDDDSDARVNRRLLALYGKPNEDFPAFVADDCACFETKLELTIKSEIGEDLFEQLLASAMQRFEMKKQEALKRPAVMLEILHAAAKKGCECPTLTSIVKKASGQTGKT
jgi:putative ATP-dependent endonuclease of the OLD family